MKTLIYLLIGITTLNCIFKRDINPTLKINEKIILINHFRVICKVEAATKCFQIKELFENEVPVNWSTLSGGIDGFYFEPGFIYKMKIKETRLKSQTAPLDSFYTKRTLIELIEKTEVPFSPLNGKWKAVFINKIDPALVAQFSPYIALSNGQLSGFDGCNTLFSSYKKGLTSIEFKSIGQTKRACGNGDNYLVSNAFTFNLKHTYRYKINENSLSLLNGIGEVLITLIRN